MEIRDASASDRGVGRQKIRGMLALLTLASPPPLPDLRVRADVRDAIANNRPVVALESTIISHGMPYPKNLEVARAVEAVVRDAGALPCTIAVLDGVCICGLSDAELERFAQLTSAQCGRSPQQDY